MSDFELRVGPALARALQKKGYETLTPVQEAVLATERAGRDMRISSQTGSGKTLAIGFLLRESVDAWADDRTKPCALVIAPTRELAKQVESELRWIFAEVPATVTSLTGGASYRDELRAMQAKPAIVVGTPGRLLDHLNRKSFDAGGLGAIVLDEADRMLDMGFKEELEQIFEHAPPEHRTHLVSATFPREVKYLADKIQTNPVYVEGTPLGAANVDIDHVMYVVDSKDRLAAVINLLIAARGARTLIFVRTREAVANLSRALREAGFRIESISGDMEQPARNRALAAFKRGDVDALVATDVAARGIDVSDLARVIHADPPGDDDTYTHRSGRTGRAGKKGESAILLVPPAVARMQFMLKRARIVPRFAPVPDAEALRTDADEAMFAELSGAEPADHELGDRNWQLATRLGAAGDVKRVVARLLAKAQRSAGVEPREVRNILPRDAGRRPTGRYEEERPMRSRAEERPRPERSRFIDEPRFPLPSKVNERPSKRDMAEERPSKVKLSAERPSKIKLDERPSKRNVTADRDTEPDLKKATRVEERSAGRETAERSERLERAPRQDRGERAEGGWVSFRVTWGSLHGADPRRLVAMLCRRGNIEGRQIGSIKIAPHFSTVMVQDSVAEEFATAALEKDERNPKVAIRPDRGEPDDSGDRSAERPRDRGDRPAPRERSGAPSRDRSSGDRPAPRERSGAPSRERAGERPPPRAYVPRNDDRPAPRIYVPRGDDRPAQRAYVPRADDRPTPRKYVKDSPKKAWKKKKP
jgi:ATP-dependent RNA helicase DeaD